MSSGKKKPTVLRHDTDICNAIENQEDFEIEDLINLQLTLVHLQYEALEHALKHTCSLKELKIDFESVLSFPGILKALTYNESIETLHICVETEAYDYYPGRLNDAEIYRDLLIKNKTIKSLQIENSMGMDGFGFGLEKNTTLTSLNLSKSVIRAQHLDKICSALQKNTTVKSLDLSVNQYFKSDGCRPLADLLRNNTTLTYLNIKSTHYVKSDGWKEFFGGLKFNSSLIELNIAQSSIKEQECVYINDAIKYNKILARIDLNGNEIGSQGLISLFRDLNPTKSGAALTSINLYYTKLDSTCCEELCRYVSLNDQMTELDLSFNQITSDGCKWIGKMLKNNKHLTELHLKFNPIGSEGLKYIAEGLKWNTRLIRINFQDCGIDFAGCKYLAEAISVNPCLMHINLLGNNIGEQGCQELISAMSSNISVTDLAITKTEKIDAKILEQLIAAQNRNKIHHRLLISNIMTILINLARRSEETFNSLPLELWLRIFKQLSCGAVPGFDQIALSLFSQQLDCHNIADLVKMKIVRQRSKSVLVNTSEKPK